MGAIVGWCTPRRLAIVAIAVVLLCWCYAIGWPAEREQAAQLLRDQGYDVISLKHDMVTDLRCAKGLTGYRVTVRPTGATETATSTATQSVPVCAGYGFAYRPGHHPFVPWL